MRRTAQTLQHNIGALARRIAPELPLIQIESQGKNWIDDRESWYFEDQDKNDGI